jgi:hypothetical protein
LENSFIETLKNQHLNFLNEFESYRDQLTDVLFYGERISRSELKEGKDDFFRGLRSQLDRVQNVLLPAVTDSEKPPVLSGVGLFADVQDNLLDIANRTEENVDFFANPDAPKEERNDAARETLKDLYRLDSVLGMYFNLLETHLLPEGEDKLDADEKDKLLEPLSGYANG